ncbi:iron-binding protein [Candidatus Micrarchaeota archaeon RBG_16_36_9]|nr:MAG: iron-binding protein [Candidatus Micrarchaeota archaeon RBG_16_36_9]
MEKFKIKICKDGPYILSGKIPLDKQIISIDKEGEPETWIQGERYPLQDCSLCRCGHSKNQPFCDGTHTSIGFNGTETASREPFDKQAEVMDGPTIRLKDASRLCAIARFCHRGGGTWELTKHSDDPESRKLAIEEACQCPSGRLVACDKKTGETIETRFEPSVSMMEDPQKKSSGPLWVKGGIQIESSDGFEYEKRNRCTLCRCGKSENKPFCDGSHIDAKFNDGDNSLK